MFCGECGQLTEWADETKTKLVHLTADMYPSLNDHEVIPEL